MDDSEVQSTDLFTLIQSYLAGSVTLDKAADAIASHLRQAQAARNTSPEETGAFFRELKARHDAKTPPDMILDAQPDPEQKRALDLLNKALSKRFLEGAS